MFDSVSSAFQVCDRHTCRLTIITYSQSHLGATVSCTTHKLLPAARANTAYVLIALLSTRAPTTYPKPNDTLHRRSSPRSIIRCLEPILQGSCCHSDRHAWVFWPPAGLHLTTVARFNASDRFKAPKHCVLLSESRRGRVRR